MINSGVNEEEILNSFEDLNFQTKKETPHSPRSEERVEDLLGQPSGKFDYKVFYSKPPSYDISIESIIPEGWGDEFNDEKLVEKEDKETKVIEQPQMKEEEEIMPANGIKLMSRKETCMVEMWKDEKRDRTIGVIDIWYNSDEESIEKYNVWVDNPEVSHVTRSGKGYKPAEKKVEKTIEQEEEAKEEDSEELDDNLILEQLKKAKANVSI